MNYKYQRKNIRKELKNIQNNCVYCNCKLSFDDSQDINFATIEHIVPQSKNGSQNIDNLTLACSICNTVRGDKDSFIGFQFKNDQDFFLNKEDYKKTLQYCNLANNFSILNKLKKLAKAKKQDNMQVFLEQCPQYKFVKHIINLLVKLSDKVWVHIQKFIDNLVLTTKNQMELLNNTIDQYQIEVMEFSIFENGLVKQKFN